MVIHQSHFSIRFDRFVVIVVLIVVLLFSWLSPRPDISNGLAAVVAAAADVEE